MSWPYEQSPPLSLYLSFLFNEIILRDEKVPLQIIRRRNIEFEKSEFSPVIVPLLRAMIRST